MNGIEIAATKFRNHLNRIFPSNQQHFFTSAIITAAGSGVRMGGVSKPLYILNGRRCIAYSLCAFDQCDSVNEIIVTAKESEISEIEKVCLDCKLKKPWKVVCGGNTRQESVMNGFLAIDPKADLVAIHDAARPLITPKFIENLINHAKRYGACCAAKKITDTVKKAKENGVILETVPRDELYTVQTPQVFKTDLYRAALALSNRDGVMVTDDCALAEHAGFPVKLVMGDSLNLKLTTPDDVSVISCLLEGMKNE